MAVRRQPNRLIPGSSVDPNPPAITSATKRMGRVGDREVIQVDVVGRVQGRVRLLGPRIDRVQGGVVADRPATRTMPESSTGRPARGRGRGVIREAVPPPLGPATRNRRPHPGRRSVARAEWDARGVRQDSARVRGVAVPLEEATR